MDVESLLAGQYSGAKAALRPIYERLREVADGLGPEVSVIPAKTMVGFWHGRQFARIQPSTLTRVDLTLAVPGEPTTERLKVAKSTAVGRINRVIGLTSPDEVDDEVIGWIRAAYEGTRR